MSKVWFYRHDDSTPWRRLRHSLTSPRPAKSPMAKLRWWWGDFVIHPIFEGGELCQDCGHGYVLWHSDSDLWMEVKGRYGGLLCPSCFDKRARKLGVIVIFQATEFRRRRLAP